MGPQRQHSEGPASETSRFYVKAGETVKTTTGPTLTEEMRAVQKQHPGWHVWKSSAGRIWAATAENHTGGSGTTLDAPTPEAMHREIAVQVHEWEACAA
jgi:hypothetical protein